MLTVRKKRSKLSIKSQSGEVEILSVSGDRRRHHRRFAKNADWRSLSMETTNAGHELPEHQDYGDPCTHVEAYENVKTHTSVHSYSIGGGLKAPKICRECSDAIQEWVQWPCPRMKEKEDDVRAT